MSDVTYLIYDTETTGKIVNGQPAPHLWQLSGEIFTTADVISRPSFNFLVEIPPEVDFRKGDDFFTSRGIEKERINPAAVAPQAAVFPMLKYASLVDGFVAYNAAFDKKIITETIFRSYPEAQRDKAIAVWEGARHLCLMKTMIPLCKLPKKNKLPGKYGWPSLFEAFVWVCNKYGQTVNEVMGIGPDEDPETLLHDADMDNRLNRVILNYCINNDIVLEAV